MQKTRVGENGISPILIELGFFFVCLLIAKRPLCVLNVFCFGSCAFSFQNQTDIGCAAVVLVEFSAKKCRCKSENLPASFMSFEKRKALSFVSGICTFPLCDDS